MLIRHFVVLFGLCSPMLANAVEVPHKKQLELRLKSFSYSNITTINSLLNDRWHQPPQTDATTAFTYNELGLSYRRNDFHFTIKKRISAQVKTNAATSTLYYWSKQEIDNLSIPQTQIALVLNTEQSTGLLIGYQAQLANLIVEFELGYWRVERLRDSTLNGTVSVIAGQYRGHLLMEEHYSDNNFLKRPHLDDFKRTGDGFSANVKLEWDITSTLTLSLDIKDLYATYRIKKHGYSTGQVNTNNTLINDQGYQTFLPFYSGIERSDDHRFDIEPKSKLAVSYAAELGTFSAHASRLFETNFIEIGYQWAATNYQYSVRIDVERFTPTLTMSNQDWHIAFGIDKLNINDAATISLDFSYRW
ncbi:MAG: hypothetical protein HRU25_10640 [Psychrobium sp.]|nr:hypothetical protein [Psychrobium sp.]